MRNVQPHFPVDVRTGWVDYSPAFRHHASLRVRSRLASFASQIRSVIVRISADEREISSRRCDLEVMTTDAGLISASAVGVDQLALVDRALDSVLERFRQRSRAEPDSERRQRIA